MKKHNVFRFVLSLFMAVVMSLTAFGSSAAIGNNWESGNAMEPENLTRELIVTIEESEEDGEKVSQKENIHIGQMMREHARTMEIPGLTVKDSITRGRKDTEDFFGSDFSEKVEKDLVQKNGYVYLVQYDDTYSDWEEAKEAVEKQLLAEGFNVKHIEQNDEVEILESNIIHPYQNWNYDMIKVQEAWGASKGLETVEIAVLDTGVDHNHESLKSLVNVGAGKNFSTSGSENDTMDRNGHGSHVAGIIASYNKVSGVSKNASIVPIKVMNDDGRGSQYGIVKGMYYAVEQGVDIINMSIGSTSYNSSYKEASDFAVENGIVVVAAAGNSGTGELNYPAGYDSVIAVGSVDENGERSSFSNFGEGLDVMAPGSGIYSTIPGNKYSHYSGTSMAASHISGIAGIIKSIDPDKTVEEVKEILVSSASYSSTATKTEYGAGLVSAYEAAIQTQATEEKEIEKLEKEVIEENTESAPIQSVEGTEENTESVLALAQIISLEVTEGGYIGTEYHMASYGESLNTILYQFAIQNMVTGKWMYVPSSYSTNNQAVWIPEEAGEYRIRARVKDEYSLLGQDSRIDYFVEVKTPRAVATSLDVNEGGYIGTEYHMTLQGESPNILYQFAIQNMDTGRWTYVPSSYSKNNQAVWIPEEAGEYRIRARVKDEHSIFNQDSRIDYFVEVKDLRAQATNVRVNEGGYVGTEYHMELEAEGLNILYQFAIQNMDTGKWTYVPSSYSTNNQAVWIPEEAGEYRIRARVKDENSPLNQDSRIDYFVEVKTPRAVATSLEVNEGGFIGTEYHMTLQGESPNILYQFAIQNMDTGKWTYVPSSYSKNNEAVWIPEEAGEYRIRARVKDEYSIFNQDSRIDYFVNVQTPRAKAIGVEVSEGGFEGTEYHMTLQGESPNILYQFAIQNIQTGRWTYVPSSYSENNKAVWIPEEAGEYRIRARVRDAYSDSNQDDRIDYFVSVFPTISFQNTYYNLTLKEMVDKQTGVHSRTDLDKYYGADDPGGGRWYISNQEGIEYYSNPENFFYTNTNEDKQLYIKVTASDILNVRSGPSTSHAILTTVPRHGRYAVVDQSNGWYKIVVGNTTGWVSGTLAEVIYSIGSPQEILPKNVKVNVSSLNVRSGPSLNHTILASVSSGETYLVIEESNGWYKINKEGTIGWISGDYVEVFNEIPRTIYQFLVLSGRGGVTSTLLNHELQSKGILSGMGAAFLEAGRQHNINEIYLVAHALLETGHGRSTLANGVYVNKETGKYVSDPSTVDSSKLVIVYNMYGIGAVDSNPLVGGAETAFRQGWTTPEKAIIDGAGWIGRNYINSFRYQQDTLYKMRWNPETPGTHQYATDIGRAMKQTRTLDLVFEIAIRNNAPLVFDTPVYQK